MMQITYNRTNPSAKMYKNIQAIKQHLVYLLASRKCICWHKLHYLDNIVF